MISVESDKRFSIINSHDAPFSIKEQFCFVSGTSFNLLKCFIFYHYFYSALKVIIIFNNWSLSASLNESIGTMCSILFLGMNLRAIPANIELQNEFEKRFSPLDVAIGNFVAQKRFSPLDIAISNFVEQ